MTLVMLFLLGNNIIKVAFCCPFLVLLRILLTISTSHTQQQQQQQQQERFANRKKDKSSEFRPQIFIWRFQHFVGL